jgi:hypothetical protein
MDVAPEEFIGNLRAVGSSKTKAPILELPGWLPAFETTLSEASTSAGPSPIVKGGGATSPAARFSTPQHSSGFARTPQAEIATEATPSDPPISLDKQCRKIFVGGIPQSVDHNELYKMFNRIAKVKKAWLQMFHPENKENQSPATTASKRHRGFGFVIFSEAASIDNLLGEASSKFLAFGEDMKLEVKRAIGKTGASSGTPDVISRQAVTGGTPQEWHSSTPAAATSHLGQSPACPTIALAVAVAVASPPHSTPMQMSAPAYTHWQCSNGANGHVENLPRVPPFPFTAPSPQVLIPVDPKPQGELLSDILFDGFVGQKPQSKQELESVLRHAMPDIYED